MHEVELTIPQTKFILETAKHPLFVAGYGAGKSTMMAVSIFNDLNYPSAEPIKVGAYAPTYDLLKLITIPYLCEFLEESRIGFKINRSDFIITLETDDKIIMRSMVNSDRIVGYETFRAHCDEMDTLPEAKAFQVWNKVVARNRQPVPVIKDGGYIYYKPEDKKLAAYVLDDNGEYRRVGIGRGDYALRLELNRVSAYTTPEGFKFAYKRWEKEPQKGYVKIQAPSYSNPHLPADYIENLRITYPAELVEAFIEGEFTNLIGKSVYPKFDRERNHTDEVVRGNEILEVGMDFNVVHGAAAIHVIRDGFPQAVDEIHDAYDTDEQIQILKNRYPNNPVNIYPDATGDHRSSSNTTETDIAKLKAARYRIFQKNKNPPIKDRVMSYNAMIYNGKKEIRYRVNTKKCPNLTNSLEQQIWGPNGLPDKSTGLDHIVDGAGYYINHRFPIVRKQMKTKPIIGQY